MPFYRGGELQEEKVMCTHCPVPCSACRGGNSGYCASTPCACPCHAGAPPPRPGADSELPPSEEELRGILRRAGVPAEYLEQVLALLLMEEGPDRVDRLYNVHVVDLLCRAAAALLRDSVREGRRWTERVKLVERRTEFAMSALRGDRDEQL